MTAAQFGALSPLVALGAGAILALLLAPLRGGAAAAPRAAAAGLLIAAWLAAARTGLPPTPVGALFTDDALARFGTCLSALATAACLVFLRAETPAREAPALAVLVALGGAVLAGAGHAVTLFLGIEIMSLALVVLFAFALTPAGLEAGYKFFLTNGLASGALMLGIAFLQAATGTLAFEGWAGPGALPSLGAALLLVGLAFKFALVPFHMWLPDAFVGAPAGAAALAGVVPKVAMAVLFLRLDATADLPEPLWTGGIAVLAAASMLGGSLAALRQVELARMLGYSAVAHSGFVAAILVSGAARSAEAVLFYMLAYAVALIAALAAGAMGGARPTLESLRGTARQGTAATVGLTLALLSLAGLPAAGGFIAKLYLFTALIEGGAWGLLAAALAGSALGFFYYARFLLAPFRGEAAEAMPLPAADRRLLAACAVVILALGVLPGPVVELLRGLVALPR